MTSASYRTADKPYEPYSWVDAGPQSKVYYCDDYAIEVYHQGWIYTFEFFDGEWNMEYKSCEVFNISNWGNSKELPSVPGGPY